jgi:hypothetical protein
VAYGLRQQQLAVNLRSTLRVSRARGTPRLVAPEQEGLPRGAGEEEKTEKQQTKKRGELKGCSAHGHNEDALSAPALPRKFGSACFTVFSPRASIFLSFFLSFFLCLFEWCCFHLKHTKNQLHCTVDEKGRIRGRKSHPATSALFCMESRDPGCH